MVNLEHTGVRRLMKNRFIDFHHQSSLELIILSFNLNSDNSNSTSACVNLLSIVFMNELNARISS